MDEFLRSNAKLLKVGLTGMIGPVIPVGGHVAVRIGLVGSVVILGLARRYSRCAFSRGRLRGDEILRILFKQWIEQIINFKLLGKFLRTLEFDPNTLEMHSTDFYDDAVLLILEDAIAFASGHSDNV